MWRQTAYTLYIPHFAIFSVAWLYKGYGLWYSVSGDFGPDHLEEAIMTHQSDYIEEGIVILALQSSMGNIGLAANELGLSRGELYDYLARHPGVAETRKQIREAIKDDAEDMLFEQMKTNPSLLVFYLRTQAADRGYSTSHTTSNNTHVEVNVDARSLIAAMRSGANLIAKDEDEEGEPEDGEFFPIPKLLDHSDGSGGVGEVLQ